MKSLSILTAAVAAILVAGCRAPAKDSDGMMTGKEGTAASSKKEGSCSMTSAGKKDDCCASESKETSAKKEGCCASEAKSTETKKSGCCAEGSTASTTKVKDGCCKGKEVSSACADCKKACEAKGGCDTGKSCDEKACDEKTKP